MALHIAMSYSVATTVLSQHTPQVTLGVDDRTMLHGGKQPSSAEASHAWERSRAGKCLDNESPTLDRRDLSWFTCFLGVVTCSIMYSCLVSGEENPRDHQEGLLVLHTVAMLTCHTVSSLGGSPPYHCKNSVRLY
jgi:hypothetical protein